VLKGYKGGLLNWPRRVSQITKTKWKLQWENNAGKMKLKGAHGMARATQKITFGSPGGHFVRVHLDLGIIGPRPIWTQGLFIWIQAGFLTIGSFLWQLS